MNILLTVNNIPYTIENISDSGVSFLGEHQLELNKTYEAAVTVFDTYKINCIGKVVWQKLDKDGVFKIGFQITKNFLPEGLVQSVEYTRELIANVRSRLETTRAISHEFQLLTFEIRDFLSTTKASLAHIENSINVQSNNIKTTQHKMVLEGFSSSFLITLKNYNKKLDSIYSKIDSKDERENYKKFFRQLVGEFYTSNPFIGRALAKPRGYAGDYEMMNQIYRDDYEGLTLFDKLMHKYGITEDSSLSVKYRKNYLMKKFDSLNSLKKDQIVIGSLASGPAREIYEYLQTVSVSDSSKFTFVLMDQDLESLLNAKRNISSTILERGLECNTMFVPLSVRAILEQTEESKMLSMISFDLLYTAGLYDYLSQPVAKLLTTYLVNAVTNDGQLIIGNFHPNNPTKTISDLAADWRLIHRTDDEMLDLIDGVPSVQIKLHKDELEIDLFLEINRK